MRFTSKCILLAIALAYHGGTAVSAAPVGKSSLAARSAAYGLASEDINAREIDDLELFVREPLSIFGSSSQTGAGLPSKLVKTVTDHVKSKYFGAPSQTVGSNTGASLTSKLFGTISDHMNPKPSKTSGTPEAPPPPQTHEPKKKPRPGVSEVKKPEAAGTGTGKKPAGTAQTPKKQQKGYGKDISKASKDPNHPLYNAAIKKQDDAIGNNPRLFKTALADPEHDLHEAAKRAKKAQAAKKNFNALPGSVPATASVDPNRKRPTTTTTPKPAVPNSKHVDNKIVCHGDDCYRVVNGQIYTALPKSGPTISSTHSFSSSISSQQSVTFQLPGRIPASMRPNIDALTSGGYSSSHFGGPNRPGSVNIGQSIHIYH